MYVIVCCCAPLICAGLMLGNRHKFVCVITVDLFEQFCSNRYTESPTKSRAGATTKRFELVQSDNENSNQQPLVLSSCIVLSLSN